MSHFITHLPKNSCSRVTDQQCLWFWFHRKECNIPFFYRVSQQVFLKWKNAFQKRHALVLNSSWQTNLDAWYYYSTVVLQLNPLYSLSWWCAVFCPVSVILFSQLHSQKSSNWHTSRQKKGAYCCYIKLRKRETRIAFSVQKARIAASTILCREYAGSHRLSFKDLAYINTSLF